MGFVYGVTLPAHEICNLDEETNRLCQLALKGERIVVFGQRNTGKTSILKNVVIPNFRKSHAQALTVFADLMGVVTQANIDERLRIAFERAISDVHPTKAHLKTLVESLQSFHPTMSVDPLTGSLSFSIGSERAEKSVPFEEIFRQIGHYHQQSGALIVLDEFQDVALVREAQERLRSSLQDLPGDLPVITSASKKHLLGRIFGRANAPFAGWGTDISIPNVKSAHYLGAYHAYISRKFVERHLSIARDVSDRLIGALSGIPEPINIVCAFLLENSPEGFSVDAAAAVAAIENTATARGSRFEELLSKMTASEQRVLVAIAKNQPVIAPKGKDFLSMVPSVSPSAVYKIIGRLENNAEIYRDAGGYTLADPLLAHYLRIWR